MNVLKTAATAVAFAATVASGATATERWKVPVSFPTGLPGIGEPLKDWAATINAADADIQVKLFEPGEIVPPFAVLDAVRDNKVPAGMAVIGYSAGSIPATALLFGAPFGLGPREYAGWYYQGGGEALTQALLNKNGVHGFLCGMIGAEMGGWFREPLNSIEDFKGLRFRTAGLGADVLTRLGMSVTTLPLGETFPALERGAIDAAEGSLPSVDVILGLHKVAKHGYFPGWHQPVGTGHLVINQGVWDGLSDAQKEAVETSCEAITMKNLTISDSIQAASMAKAKADGAEFHVFSDEMIEAFRKATAEVMAEQSAKDADFKEIYESMEAHKKLVSGYLDMSSAD
ncbi:TRAP-type mannitol/chloroaromatic compound transport system, substrate-binding protein [Shimia aestuarii]|uniref:TRAP-type mannitol/chloroaromatic compound transport system, substrate-binding protein n=2 Tax=Shimia aestuarii TaxID=254406 RepID=A0A1I4TPZ3_9RHOB|nr:TRAP-type mannitol/chloroaromatic compound transport system, substrate-binding protein [Shimia aestuarii]